MNTALPTQKTKRPSRKGLLFHEILTDAIIHAAIVFGIEPNDQYFVERVANLAWCNGVEAARVNAKRAATVAQLFREGLEIGHSKTRALCDSVGIVSEREDRVFDVIRGHYAAVGSRDLATANRAHAYAIRQLVGEAILAGLSCRVFSPNLCQSVTAAIDSTKMEQRFLCGILLEWSESDAPPPIHPFVQMAKQFYVKNPEECSLLCELLESCLPGALETDAPWSLSRWLEQGWRIGSLRANFVPESVQRVYGDVGVGHLTYCRELYRECLLKSTDKKGRPDLAAAFEKYIAGSQHCGLHLPAVRALNPRLLAARAWDFTTWMGFLSQMPDEC